ncbi:MAG: PAS domain-containing protein, partial [Myxococcota bacterium]|nr:PAS domain-containing protein [Myxococcota bacterium]
MRERGKTNRTTSSRLRKRLQATEQRLEEAEQTLEAIRSGKVDALIVDGPSGERVFTLQGADHRYRLIVEGMTEGAVIVSPEGAVLYANSSFAQLVATPLDRVLGSPFRQYVPPEAAGTLARLLAEAQKGTTAAEGRLLVGAGELVPVHISATAEEATNQGGICLIVTDLTQAMQETRRQHADEFRQLIDNVPDLAWHALPDGYVEFYNQRWYDYTGTTLEQMQGWGWKSVHRPDMVDEVTARWQRSLDSGEPFEMEFPLRGADGVYRWFLTRVRPLRGAGGHIVRWFGTNTNIDEQKRAASSRAFLESATAALSASLDVEESLGRLAKMAVSEIADSCSISLRQTGGALGEVVVVHKDDAQVALLRSVHGLGYDPQAPTGPPRVLRTGEPELVERVTDETLKKLARNQEQLGWMRRLNLQSWIGVPLKRQRDTVGALFVALTTPGRRYTSADVPLLEELGRRASIAIENARLYREAQIAVEAERRAKDRAEEATRLKDEFLATLSHELRTPLNAILGWSRMLQSGTVTDEKRARGVDTIVRNAVAQNQLIEDLLDVSRIVSGKMRLSVEMIDVSNVVAAALDVVQPAADAKGVRLQPLLDPDAGFVAGDGTRLQQVVWNLLTNAVKFTPRGGRVRVSLRRESSSVELAVSDTGAGIARDFLPYVFDRFRQQDGSSTRKTGGLGLGLA